MPPKTANARGAIYESIRESYNTIHIKQVTLENAQAQEFLPYTFKEPHGFKRATWFSRHLNQFST